MIGGGINGLACAWKLAEEGHVVSLYERGKLMSSTSRASTKLLHGGLRYLENFEFRLVFEALSERDAWLVRVPELTNPISIIIPIYHNSLRKKWVVGLGLKLYSFLSYKSPLPRPQWLALDEIVRENPTLKTEGLIGGYKFYDGQMDDYRLGLWVAEQCRALGVVINEDTNVLSLESGGSLETENHDRCYFDRIVNLAGPWAEELLRKSGFESNNKLDLVRGSHIIIQKKCTQGMLLEVPRERRIFFVLPWQGNTMIGTTEVRQSINEPVECSNEEVRYLLRAYNNYFTEQISRRDIISKFAGLRPLIFSTNEPSKATREYSIDRTDKLINVFGGKWTTSLALARKISRVVLNGKDNLRDIK